MTPPPSGGPSGRKRGGVSDAAAEESLSPSKFRRSAGMLTPGAVAALQVLLTKRFQNKNINCRLKHELVAKLKLEACLEVSRGPKRNLTSVLGIC